jgi:hypothetical protein
VSKGLRAAQTIDSNNFGVATLKSDLESLTPNPSKTVYR